MQRSTKRLLTLLAAVPVVVLLVALVYQQGMTHLEGKERSLATAIEWAAETITTTGYGHDNEWQHPFMTVFVIATQFLGLFMAVLLFPIFLIPFFEERFEGRLPKTLPRLGNHVVIYRWGPEITTLIDDLESAHVPVLVLEEDPLIARRLHDRGRAVVVTSFRDEDPDLSSLHKARGIVANGSDHDNAVFVMAARQQGYTGPIVSLVANPKRRNAMSRAGATAVFTPKHALAGAIAAKASVKITPRVSGAPMLGDQVVVGEVRVDATSSLAGKTLAASQVGKNTGVTVIGLWVEGELTSATPTTRCKPGSILVAAGGHDNMEALAQMATPVPRSGPFVVCGYGEVGSKVTQLLHDAGEQVVTIDTIHHDGVTHLGDALDPDHLANAGVLEAQAVIITLGNDAETVFAAAVVRDLSPDAIIIASAQRARNVPRIHRAGADFGFSMGQVAGQLMHYQLLGEKSMSLQSRIKIANVDSSKLIGKNLLAAEIRERTGCSVVALERDGNPIEFDDSFILQQGDAVYVSGSQQDIGCYLDLFGS